MDKIDFVITWVDGNDKEWNKVRKKYTSQFTISNSTIRYRDWDNLKYWFRGVENFAPWVNNIYFITWGHVPEWLNTKNDKIKIIKHDEFIPKEYLPTFNSNTIELNLHRIKELSNNFVLFNDDMFIIKKVKKQDFFKNGLPVDECVQNVICPEGENNPYYHALINNIDIINRHFKKREVMKRNFSKYINLKYGFKNTKTILLLPWKTFTGFNDNHISIPYLKHTFEKIWGKEQNILNEACKNKFRSNNDVTNWLMRYWQLCEGNFKVRKSRFGKYFDISSNTDEIEKWIKKQKSKIICINDTKEEIDFNNTKNNINNAFEKILPKKSSFEI